MLDAIRPVLFYNILLCVDAARILAYFPTPSISHQVVFRPLTQELAKRGHEVVVITADPAFPKGQALTNLTEIDVHDLSYNLWKKFFLTTSAGNKDDVFEQMQVIFTLMNTIIEKQFQTEEVQSLVRGKDKFDLLLLEAFPRQLLVLSHIFKVPVIQISSFGTSFTNYHTMGAPTHDLMYPIHVRQKLYNLTMIDKIIELYRIKTMERNYNNLVPIENAMVKRVFGNDVPPLEVLANNVDMLFLNIHPIWEGARPVPPSVIYINGILKKPETELPQVRIALHYLTDNKI
jgi:glucuronosyltransferase